MVFSFYVLSESCYLSGIIVVKDEIDDFRSNFGGEFCEFAEDVEHGNSSIFLVGLFVVRGDIVDVDGKNAGYDGKECFEHVCVCGCLIV